MWENEVRGGSNYSVNSMTSRETHCCHAVVMFTTPAAVT